MKRTPLKRKTSLRRVSAKQRAKLGIYANLRVAYLGQHRVCQTCRQRPSTQIHHKARRGKHLNDVATWLAVCWECHRAIHDRPAWAREQGYLV